MGSFLNKPLAILKEEWSALILKVNGIPETFTALKNALPKASEKYETVHLMEAEFNDTNRKRFRNLITEEVKGVEYSRIRQNLLDLINDLTESDFNPEKAIAASGPKPKTEQEGYVLYRIPDTMPKDKESRCIVRISYDEDKIIENIELDQHVEVKSTRVSDYMSVELFDPSSVSHFEIRSINSTKQFIEVGENTEWIFYVVPLSEGTFPLVIKVSIIEIIDGEKIPREIVLEEQVKIVIEGEVEKTEDYLRPVKESEEALSFAFLPLVTRPAAPRVAPSPKSATRFSLIKAARMLSVLLVISASIWVFSLFSGGPDQKEAKPNAGDIPDSIQENTTDHMTGLEDIAPSKEDSIAGQVEEVEKNTSDSTETTKANIEKLPGKKDDPKKKEDETKRIEKQEPKRQPLKSRTIIINGKKTKTLEVYGKPWLAENLNLETPESWCYEAKPEHCKQYGRLYTYEGAMKACASLGKGWRLPDQKDWNQLIDLFGGSKMAGSLLRKEGVNSFYAQLGGYYTENNGYIFEERYGYYWMRADNQNGGRISFYYIGNNVDEILLNSFKEVESPRLSCRCIKD